MLSFYFTLILPIELYKNEYYSSVQVEILCQDCFSRQMDLVSYPCRWCSLDC